MKYVFFLASAFVPPVLICLLLDTSIWYGILIGCFLLTTDFIDDVWP